MAYLMLVDDDEDFATAAATVLRSAGHEVQTELSPAQVVAKMQKRRPDLVILDVMFPEGQSSGFNLASTLLKDDQRLRGIPVLMLTGVNAALPLGITLEDMREFDLPAADFVEKPVDFDVLCAKVDALLAQPGSVDRRSGARTG